MKVYVITDLEGVSGVIREEQTQAGNREYEEACLLLTREVNAAVEGAVEAGASEVLVNDGHGARGGFNLVAEELHRAARYITGGPRPVALPGLNGGFNAAFLIGYHAMAGTRNAVLDHTMSTRVIYNAYINGVKVGEIGIEAAILGYFGIPVSLVTGCRKAVEEAQTLLGNVETVAVKEGFSRNFAVCLAPAEARERIRAAAKKSLERLTEFKPFTVNPPVTVEVEYTHPNYADMQARTPGIERIDARKIKCVADDLLDAMRRVGWY